MTSKGVLSIDSEVHDASQSQSTPAQTSKKRSDAATALDANGNPKPAWTRSTMVCTACRARKVRCDVMEKYHMAANARMICSNCRMKGIKCVFGKHKGKK
jgi:hypothetical protein